MVDSAVRALNPDEERLWRALNRILIALPRALDDDLARETGLSLNAYGILMNLSEAPGRELRMSELAAAATLSASRVTRLVDELRAEGLVDKRPCVDDRRGTVTVLTDVGLARLRAAYTLHLASARRRVMDRIRPATTVELADTLGVISAALED